jgi:RNase P/RNase MRP subunit POP5
LINFDAERKVYVVKCLLAMLPEVRASIACVTSVAEAAASVNVLAVSGTLKALYSNV